MSWIKVLNALEVTWMLPVKQKKVLDAMQSSQKRDQKGKELNSVTAQGLKGYSNQIILYCKPKARVVRIDCRRSYVRRCIKGAMMSFKEETAGGINVKMIN